MYFAICLENFSNINFDFIDHIGRISHCFSVYWPATLVGILKPIKTYLDTKDTSILSYHIFSTFICNQSKIFNFVFLTYTLIAWFVLVFESFLIELLALFDQHQMCPFANTVLLSFLFDTVIKETSFEFLSRHRSCMFLVL